MVNGIIYKCTECQERFYFGKKYDSVLKAPCPTCDTCAIKLEEDKTNPISSDKTVNDIYPNIMKFGGR